MIDQLAVQPPLLIFMFLFLDSTKAAIREIRPSMSRTLSTVGPTIVNSWKFWPLAVWCTWVVCDKCFGCCFYLFFWLKGIYTFAHVFWIVIICFVILDFDIWKRNIIQWHLIYVHWHGPCIWIKVPRNNVWIFFFIFESFVLFCFVLLWNSIVLEIHLYTHTHIKSQMCVFFSDFWMYLE